MRRTKTTIHKPIVALLIAHLAPEKIILFGSHARGTATKESDRDLLVIAKTQSPFVRRLRDVAVLKSAAHMEEPSDILIYSPKEFAAMKKRWNPFFRRIQREGEIIYDRAYAHYA